MLERFVVAHDGSDWSQAALGLAFELARRPGVHLTIAHVIEWRDPQSEVQQFGLGRMIDLAQEEWEGRLAALAADAPPEASVDTEVLVAPRTAPALLDLLEHRRADVLVAGSHGVGGFKPLLGSVSHQLLEHAPCSVLLVRDRPRREGAPVVVAAVDGSDAGATVVATAQRAAALLSAHLVLAHVAERLTTFVRADATHALHEWTRERGREVLHDARALVSAPLEVVTEELREGHPKHELLALCEERRPTLVVAGSRGLHGFAGLLLGSTARDLVNNAGCPVLIARDDPPAREGQAP